MDVVLNVLTKTKQVSKLGVDTKVCYLDYGNTSVYICPKSPKGLPL